MSYEPPVKTRVRWGRVALFYAIALGWVSLIAALLYLANQRNLSGAAGPTVLTVVLALLYMPAPLVAALIVGRLDHRPALIRTTFQGFWRKLPKLIGVALTVIPALLLGMVGMSWVVGNLIGFDAAGTMLFTHEDLVANTLTLVPGMNADQVAAMGASVPPFWGLIGMAFLGAIVAGFTINGLFAFGEEYGWRGWLADELRPLGAFWVNVITGVLWGLWHAPLILMGFNYGEYTRLGPFFMVAWCVAASFLLWRAREVTGSLLAPAVLHGAINGFAGVFTVLLAGANPLVAVPMGVLGSGTVAVVAAVFWWLTRKRTQPAA